MTIGARYLPWLSLLAAGALLPACDDDDAGIDPPACTAAGPVGLAPGEVVPNAQLSDCAGRILELRDLCPRKAAFVYAFASW